MSKPDAAVPDAPVWRIMAGRLAPLAGAIACTIGCLGFPAVAAALSAVGLGFLRTDWLLIPLDALSIAFVIRGFVRSRVRRQNAARQGSDVRGGTGSWWSARPKGAP